MKSKSSLHSCETEFYTLILLKIAVNDADICKIAKTDVLNVAWNADNDKYYLFRLSNLKKENESYSHHQ